MMIDADAEHAQRHRVFVVIVRSRALRLRLSRARRQTSWLIQRSRYLIRRFPPPGGEHHQLPGHVVNT